MAAPPPATVLVVEDEDDLREACCRILHRQGLRTLGAADPQQALALCRDHPGVIDLLLTDLGLPGVSGGELARIATAVRPGLRVLFVSGYGQAGAVRQGLVDPDAVVLAKPFTAAELAGATRAALARQPLAQ